MSPKNQPTSAPRLGGLMSLRSRGWANGPLSSGHGFEGKELSKWVEKLFEVTINPDTLRKRAERLEEKSLDKCPKKSQPIETVEYSKPEIIEDRKPQVGGEREGNKANAKTTESSFPAG